MYDYINKWYSINTLRDYLRLLDEVPSYYELGEVLWEHHKDIGSFSVRGLDIIGSVVIDKNLKSLKIPEFKNWEYHTPGYLPKGEEADFKNNFSYGFDRYKISEQSYAKQLGFEGGEYVIGLHTQKPGDIKGIHYDHYTKLYENYDPACGFDPVRRQISRKANLESYFIFLEDQVPGQGIGYLNEENEEKYLSWSAGDICKINWKTTPHWTFNSSYTNRNILLLTGYKNG